MRPPTKPAVVCAVVGACAAAALTLGILNVIWTHQARRWLKTGRVKEMPERLDALREDVLSALLAEKVEQVVTGAPGDQERCLRLARWVAAHVSNRPAPDGDELTWFAHRAGECGARARLLVRMLQMLHVPAGVFNLYNFGRPGGGHSCVQAWYDGQWHFLDPTYAGAFVREGKVLSWDEIRADPAGAVKNIVVFDDTLDRHGKATTAPHTRPRVINRGRMAEAYTSKAIGGLQTFGFLGSADVKLLRAPVDLGALTGPLTLGRIDRESDDVTRDGVRLKISESLGLSLGTAWDTFQARWEFRNARPGRTYAIRYHVHKATRAGMGYWARGSAAEILAGGQFVSTRALAKGRAAVWEIRFRPDAADCSIHVGYDFRDRPTWLHVDRIEIAPSGGD